MTRSAPNLMERRAVPNDRLEMGLRRRRLHVIRARHVEGKVATNAEVDAVALMSASTGGSISPGGVVAWR